MSIFGNILTRKPKSNIFHLNYENCLTTDFGRLVPFLKIHTIPGDKFKISTEFNVKFAPMVTPAYTRVDLIAHYFFIPYRLIWDNWKEFITGGRNGDSDVEFPRFSATNLEVNAYNMLLGTGSLADYLGFPQFSDSASGNLRTPEFSLLPFRAYQLIYNEYYRDQNLEEEINIFKDEDGLLKGFTVHIPLFTLRYKAWRKDYFTSALPWAQRGSSVKIPLLESEIPIEYVEGNYPTKVYPAGDGDDYSINNTGTTVQVRPISQDNLTEGYLNATFAQGSSGQGEMESGVAFGVDNSKNLRGVVGSEQNIDLEDLRYLNRLQEWLEKNARGGSRYIEQIFSHFGVRSSDARLQRPELLGGGVQPVIISEVLQTSETTETGALGTKAGDASSFGTASGFKNYFCEEHGIILGILSVIPHASYFQGISRHETKFDKLDYYFPEFAHLGEQAIQNQEIFAQYNQVVNGGINDETNMGTFGYAPRYSEYKMQNSEIHGDFKKQGLDAWVMPRKFSSLPALNKQFVHVNESIADNNFAVDSDFDFDRIWIQSYNKIKAKRRMPKHAIPYL